MAVNGHRSRLRSVHLVLAFLLADVILLRLSEASTRMAGKGSVSTGTMPRAFDLAKFSLLQLKDPSPDEMDRLREAVTDVGMLAIIGDGGASDLSSGEEALVHLARCVSGGGLRDGEDVLQTYLSDGTRKTTIATATNGTSVLDVPEGVQVRCPEFHNASKALRSSVDLAGRVYARLLDRLVHGASATGPVPAGRGDSYVSAVLSAESLEHFHLFENDGPAEKEKALLDLHSDMGLFIIMTAAEYVEMARGERADDGLKPENGFYLELADGELVKPVIPLGSLLVMNGEGITRWMRLSPTSPRPHVPGHELLRPEMAGLGRAWFGRMFLPPRGAFLQSLQGEEAPPRLTFGEYRQMAMEALREGGHPSGAAGCAPIRRGLVEVTDCSGGEVYCWMSCFPIPEDANCTRDEIQCRNPVTGQFWPEDFLARTVVQQGAGCVAYLFDGWVLDNTAKFVMACLGTIFLGLTVEGLGSFRHKAQSAWTPGNSPFGLPGFARVPIMTVLYTIQITLSYFLMLLSMTYQVELFAMVIVGLVAGHLVFNLKAPVAQSSDACCQGHDPNSHGARISEIAADDSDGQSDTQNTEDTVGLCPRGGGISLKVHTFEVKGSRPRDWS